jgi:transposase
MRPKGSPAELERRRIRAVKLVERGELPSVVARILGVDRSTVYHWRRMAHQPGGLDARPVVHPPKLSDPQLRELQELLLKGATAHGWANNLWTAGRVTTLIQRHFGIQFHPEHVRKILKRRLNWSSQRPQRQHPDGNDAAIALWVEEEFPRILSEAASRNAYLAFVDETGFMLNPLVRRTFAPRGKTPVNHVADPHARISVIGAITVDPRRERVGLIYNMLGDNANFRGPGIAYFLRMLQAEIGGPVTLLWDRITIHSCEQVKQCLKGASGLATEAFPPGAPAINPADGIWGYIKYGRLPNYTPPDLDVLRTTITEELDRLRQEEDLLRSFIRHTKLPLDLLAVRTRPASSV